MADRPEKLRLLDLFSGIGGISVALRPWCSTVCYVENDPYAVAVLCKNMAQALADAAPVWDDVRTFGRSELESTGPVDIVAAGFPCQDISKAGKKKGIGGPNTGLFSEVVRIVRLARPEFVFLENVATLTVWGMGNVLSELARIGFDAEWTMLSAGDVGAPHQRRRTWILAYTAGARRLRTDATGDPRTRGIFGEPGPGGRVLYWDETQPGMDRMADGIPRRLDRLTCLGNSVVPQCTRCAFEILNVIRGKNT